MDPFPDTRHEADRISATAPLAGGACHFEKVYATPRPIRSALAP
jgi:hypothetical protein